MGIKPQAITAGHIIGPQCPTCVTANWMATELLSMVCMFCADAGVKLRVAVLASACLAAQSSSSTSHCCCCLALLLLLVVVVAVALLLVVDALSGLGFLVVLVLVLVLALLPAVASPALPSDVTLLVVAAAGCEARELQRHSTVRGSMAMEMVWIAMHKHS